MSGDFVIGERLVIKERFQRCFLSRDRTGQPNYNGSQMLPSYLRCMRGRGWRFDYTQVRRHHGWIDPDTGLWCHSIMGGFGSVCSNY